MVVLRISIIRIIVFWDLYWGPPLFWETTISVNGIILRSIVTSTPTMRFGGQGFKLGFRENQCGSANGLLNGN